MDSYWMRARYHLKTLWDIIDMTIILILVYLFAIYLNLLDAGLALLPAYSIFLLVWVLPQIIVYLRYIKLSKNIAVYIDSEKKQIEAEISGRWRNYKFEDVKSITRIVTNRAGRRKNPRLRWGDFFCFVIGLRSREEIIITSLMTDKATIDIDGRENQIEPQGIGWISIKDRDIVNLQRI